MRSYGDVIVQVEEHRRMLLDRQQQVGKVAQHARADRFPFQRARHSQHGDLVHRDGEVIRPELSDSLQEGPVRGRRLPEPRRHLGNIERAEELRELGDAPAGPRRLPFLACLPRLADLPPQIQGLRNDVRR